MLLLPIHSLGHNSMAADDNIVDSMAVDTVVDMAAVPSRHFEHNTSHSPIQLFVLLIPRMQPKIVDVEQYRYA